MRLLTLPRKVVGIVGPSGSGKTAVNGLLVDKFGFHRVHTGLAVKMAVKHGFGLGEEEVDGDLRDVPSAKLGGASPRIVLERVGEVVHLHAPLATAIYWRAIIDNLPAFQDRIFADGIRRQPEADAVHAYGGIVIRLTHPQNTINQDFPCDTFQKDVKEDVTVVNDGTIDDLALRVAEVVDAFARKGFIWP